VDEYKRQAGKTLEELRARAQEAASVLEKRAREAREKVGQASGYFEGRVGEVRDKGE
jgi:predicted RNase H-like HicB family nuclease